MLAILQSGLHLYHNYDSVTLPVTQARTNSNAGQPPKREHPIFQIKATILDLIEDTFIRAAGMAVLGPIAYALFIRRAAWSCSLYFAALLWDVPPSQLSYIPPYHYSLVLRSAFSGGLLIALWEFANAIFSAYLTQEPMKREQPLTSASKDPNASLLNGLQAKREVIRVISMAPSRIYQALTLLRPLRFVSLLSSASASKHGAKLFSQISTAQLVQRGLRS